MNIKKIQKEIWDNKKIKEFNTTDVNLEFCLTFNELAEAFRAYRKNLPDLDEELADVMIYLLSLAKIMDVDLEKAVLKKVKKNKKRKYKRIKGVNTRISAS